jgi:hypothetical protein
MRTSSISFLSCLVSALTHHHPWWVEVEEKLGENYLTELTHITRSSKMDLKQKIRERLSKTFVEGYTRIERALDSSNDLLPLLDEITNFMGELDEIAEKLESVHSAGKDCKKPFCPEHAPLRRAFETGPDRKAN